MKKLWLLLLLLLPALPTFAQESELCADGECPPRIVETKYHGWDAFKLSDGKTEAVVVPAVGRVLSFGRVGESNWLWSALEQKGQAANWGGWRNWGGEKTWLSPQADWGKFSGNPKSWPPPPQWDQMPYVADVLSGGHLKLTGSIAPATGTRMIREFWHDENGDFIIKQTVEKLRGAPVKFGIWNVAQVDNSQLKAVFVPRALKSDYADGFKHLGKPENITPKTVTPNLIQLVPTSSGSYKIGTDAPIVALAAIKGNWALAAVSSRPSGEYPDGDAGKNGTSVQVFGMGDPKMNYLELELLSPLRDYVSGARWTQTVHWRLEKLPSSDVNDADVHAAIEKLFTL